MTGHGMLLPGITAPAATEWRSCAADAAATARISHVETLAARLLMALRDGGAPERI